MPSDGVAAKRLKHRMIITQFKSATKPRAGSARTNRDQSAHLNYERYLSRAHDEARAGNQIDAENYYQHAEHYFRLMNRKLN